MNEVQLRLLPLFKGGRGLGRFKKIDGKQKTGDSETLKLNTTQVDYKIYSLMKLKSLKHHIESSTLKLRLLRSSVSSLRSSVWQIKEKKSVDLIENQKRQKP